MDLPFTKIDNSDISGEPLIQCLLDTKEGSDCFGHWMYECAIFLPYVNALKELYPSLMITLVCKRRYKINILSDFGITESMLIYNDKIGNTDADVQNSGHVLPLGTNYIAFVPHFDFRNCRTPLFMEHMTKFREFYRIPLEKIDKSIPILYLIRSQKENYNSPNKRKFINMNEMVSMFNKHSVHILNIDTLNSLHDQIKIVLEAKIIILEFGSPAINATWFACNSHVIFLNYYGDHVGEKHMELMHSLMKDHHVTWEGVLTTTGNWRSIDIDIVELEKRIVDLCYKSTPT